MENTITVERQKLQQLLDRFFEVCSLCNELNIGEFEEWDEVLQESKKWVKTNFGRKLENTSIKNSNITGEEGSALYPRCRN